MSTENLPSLSEIAGMLLAKVEQLNGLIDNVKTESLTKALVLFHKVDSEYTELDNAHKKLGSAIGYLERGVIVKKFDDAGQDLVRIPELGRSFYPITKYSASVKDKPKLYEWLRESDQGDLITETVNASTLAGYLKQLLETEGSEAPEDTAVLTNYKIIGSSKYTPK